jgi:hypothetical protein
MSKAPQPSKSKTLPIKVRVVIGLMSLPSLLLTAFLIKTALDGNWDTVDAFEVIYALVGMFAAYIALSGRRFF